MKVTSQTSLLNLRRGGQRRRRGAAVGGGVGGARRRGREGGQVELGRGGGMLICWMNMIVGKKLRDHWRFFYFDDLFLLWIVG